jgi:cytochrome c2
MDCVRGICLALCALSILGCSLEPDSVTQGRALLQQYQCGHCHTIPGVDGARGTLAISLDDLGKRSFLAGQIPNQADNLERWIQDPASLVPGTPMPDMGVTPGDAQLMAAYLRRPR